MRAERVLRIYMKNAIHSMATIAAPMFSLRTSGSSVSPPVFTCRCNMSRQADEASRIDPVLSLSSGIRYYRHDALLCRALCRPGR
jgi:hypothetical protein